MVPLLKVPACSTLQKGLYIELLRPLKDGQPQDKVDINPCLPSFPNPFFDCNLENNIT